MPDIVENSEHPFIVVEQLRASLGAGFAILREGFSQVLDAGLGERFSRYG